MRTLGSGLLLGLILAWVGGCSSGGGLSSWQQKIERCLTAPEQVSEFAEFSVVLADMEKHTASGQPAYYHRYKLIYATGANPDNYDFKEHLADWQEVSPARYRAHENDLGMTLVAKKGGEISRVPQPAGYQYVGDARYGEWKQDARGNSFWEFYGKYMFFSHMFNMISYGPIYRPGWDAYSGHYRRGRSYYGRDGREFGTGGSFTRTVHREYYGRQKMDPMARSRSFQSKVASRVSRSRMSPVRARSGGFGK